MTKTITQDVLKYLIKRDGRSCDIIEKLLDKNDVRNAEERTRLAARLTDLYNEIFTIANLLIAMEDLSIQMIVIEDEAIVK